MAHVYILRCSDGSYYVGSTQNLEHRLWQHQEGIGCAYTRDKRPVELVFAQEYARVVDAWGAERKIHGWSRAKREALIRGDFDALPGLSRNRQRRDESAEGLEEP
jgi:putative endonuclease